MDITQYLIFIYLFIDTVLIERAIHNSMCSNILIKRAKEVLIEPLTLLVNQMLKSGHFPSELK